MINTTFVWCVYVDWETIINFWSSRKKNSILMISKISDRNGFFFWKFLYFQKTENNIHFHSHKCFFFPCIFHLTLSACVGGNFQFSLLHFIPRLNPQTYILMLYFPFWVFPHSPPTHKHFAFVTGAMGEGFECSRKTQTRSMSYERMRKRGKKKKYVVGTSAMRQRFP